MEDAKGNKYDAAGNIVPPAQDPVTNALSVARREVVDPYAEEIASAKKLIADKAYQEQSWGDWASNAGKNLYETGMSFLPTALGGRGEVGLTDIAKGIYESGKSAATLPGDVLTGKTKVFDPTSGDLTDEVLRRGSDFTGFMTLGAGVIPAEANTLRMGMKGVPPSPEDAALKAAQEATGGDDVAAATRAAQLEALNPVPPPQGIAPPSPEHALGTQRATRTVIAPTSIKLNPAEQAIVNKFKSRADRALVASRIRETKARYPKSDGWSPFEAVGASIDDKGNPVIEWQQQKYGFNTAMQQGTATQVDPVTGEKIKVPVVEERGLRPNTPEYERAAKKATQNGVKAVEDIVRRAAEGDEAALKIIRQAGWYREFMRKGFDERGGSYPAFSDLLGATSPNTAVDQNYRYSVDLQNRFARGDFDKQTAFARDYQGSLNEFPEDKLIYRDPVGPKGPQKLQYGMNSRNAQMALADKWRQKEPNQAPKARNFSGNLGGATDEATIDVWAARFVNRMAGRKRLPPPVESGVKGKLGSNMVPTGEFGYGQDVFRRITDELNRKGNLLPYLQELGYDRLTPMDMQALTWFIEKEHWTKNNWTTTAGEGGSFEDELARYPSERWQSGVSIQQADPPSDVAMAATRNVFENSLRDDPNVNQYRVHPTIGRYAGNNERSFDLELTAKPEWNPRTWMAAVIREAQANNQYDVFFSKRLAPDQAQVNPNARPGVEIYFRDRKTLDEALPILEEFTKRNADGFTFVTDLRLRERELGGQQAPDFVGVRMQWVPEIRSRWDEDFRNAVEADPGVLDTASDEALDAMQSALNALDKAGLGVVDARVHHYDTLTVGKESYDKFLEGIENPENAAGSYEGRAGAPVDPVKRFGQSIYSHAEGRNRALRAGSEGGQPDTGGDVVGTGQPTGALTPERRDANFQSAFGQTYLKDPRGNPMRLYHLTPKDITELSAGEGNRSGPVVFLSPYADFQPAYHQAGKRNDQGGLTSELVEGANVMPVYADVRSPLVLDHPRKIREAAAKYQDGDRNFPRIITPEAKAAMEADGFDAIIFGGDNAIPYGDRPQDARLGFQESKDEEFIIFDPKRIKSATGNRGTYDTSDPDITKAFGGALADEDDIDNALRIARATGGRAGYAGAGSVPVMMEDAKGNKYDAKGNIIPPQNPGPNPARSDATPQSVAAKAVNDPATYDALMERYAVPDRDIAEYEALKATVGQQPQDIRQMTHVGDRPRREVAVDMPLFGGEYSMGTAPYDVASGMQGAAQTAYDLKTAPFYFNPITAPIAAGMDLAEGIATNDPLTASLAVGFGPGGKYAKAAGIGAVNYFMDPAEAQAGPERWFSKLYRSAEALPMEKMTGEQALAMLRKTAPQEEIKWTGLEGFASENPVTTKKALLDFLKRNQVQTQDVVLGGNKPTNIYQVKPSETVYNKYVGDLNKLNIKLSELDRDYAELSTLPIDDPNYISLAEYNRIRNDLQYEADNINEKMRNETITEMGGLGRPVRYGPGSSYGEQYVTPGGESYQETLVTLPSLGQRNVFEVRGAYPRQFETREEAEKYISGLNAMLEKPEFEALHESLRRFPSSIYEVPLENQGYRSGHWDEPNVIGHIRTQMLSANPPGANRPMKLFNVDEAQSDWGKAGRDRGFKVPGARKKIADLEAQIRAANEKFSTAGAAAKKQFDDAYSPIAKAREAEEEILREALQRGEMKPREFEEASMAITEKYRPFTAPLFAERDRAFALLQQENAKTTSELYDQKSKLMDAEKGVSSAPYVTNTQQWTDLSIKKSLDQAIDSGADYFTFTPGEVQAKRYSLRNQVDELHYDPDDRVLFARKNGKSVMEQDAVEPEELEKYIGKELAQKLLSQPTKPSKWFKTPRHTITGQDLEVGGEGMIDYYNNIYKKRVEKVVKDLTGKKVQWEVLPAETSEGTVPRLGFRIDDDLREAKFPTFASGGIVNKALALTRNY
jgi:hypothetical protein